MVAVALRGAAAGGGASVAMIGRDETPPQVMLVGEEKAPEEQDIAPHEPATADPAVIAPTRAGADPPLPARTEERPRAAPDGKADAKAASPRQGYCYFVEDTFDLLRRSKKKQRSTLLLGEPQECYQCDRRVGQEREKRLSPSDCAKNFECYKVSPDKCPS
jgi:hypothetical protein